MEEGIQGLKITIKEESLQIKKDDEPKVKIQEICEKSTMQTRELKEKMNTSKDKVIDQMMNHTLGIIATNLWMFNQNTRLLCTDINNISKMKRCIEINLEHVGPIVRKIIENRIMS
jgi:hypothetical protein